MSLMIGSDRNESREKKYRNCIDYCLRASLEVGLGRSTRTSVRFILCGLMYLYALSYCKELATPSAVFRRVQYTTFKY